MIALAVISLFVGVKDIAVSDLFRWTDEQQLVMSISRIPRTVALILAGVGMSICGLIMQQMTQNRFVAPTTAGTLDAAKMGILASILFASQSGNFTRILFAFGFTFLASIIFLKIADRIRYRNIIFVPLVGLMFGGILNSITTFFAYKNNVVQNVNAWMVGDFSGILQGNYELVYLSIPAVVITYLYANKFTVVGMGENFSKNLGLNYRTVLNIGLFCVALTVSVVVLTVGTIPFLGLVIPNIVSILYGDNLRKTLPITAVFGAIFLLICDIIGRLIIFPFEVPIGMTVGIVGGVIFLILLIKKQR
ncbi:MAG: iron chelate uptake ABC transporter family permease subunit [Weeksellaceae bacterium]|nr:iron chelate uptake ABC transporter family permease subunit [Weeksellaceae bacterium]